MRLRYVNQESPKRSTSDYLEASACWIRSAVSLASCQMVRFLFLLPDSSHAVNGFTRCWLSVDELGHPVRVESQATRAQRSGLPLESHEISNALRDWFFGTEICLRRKIADEAFIIIIMIKNPLGNERRRVRTHSMETRLTSCHAEVRKTLNSKPRFSHAEYRLTGGIT